jgi:8-oxo-dGTP diphosphatase
MTKRHKIIQAVFVVIRNERGEILLQQRANTEYLNGYWDFPSGHVEYGESLHESAVRETKEEVGLEISSTDLALIHIEQFYVDRDYINYTFEAAKWSGTPIVGEPEKCSAIRWFAADALPDKCVNAVRANEHTKFSRELTYSVTTADNYDRLIK